jgi:hypothetical protein
MGRPISNRLFGNTAGKIAVTFHNGTAVVDGFIIKQTGSRRFLVGGFAGAAGDGAAMTMVCNLAQTDDALTTGQCAISVTPHGGAAARAKSISTFRVLTVAGVSLRYKLGVASAAAGEGTVAVLAAPVEAFVE